MKCVFCKSEMAGDSEVQICSACQESGVASSYLNKIDKAQRKQYASDNLGIRKATIGKAPEVNSKRDDYVVWQFNKTRPNPRVVNETNRYREETDLQNLLNEIEKDIKEVNKRVL